MNNLIVMLLGGISGEREISFLTGKACSIALKKKGYKVINVDAKGYFVEKLRKLKPKAVFNALHGRYGEDGFVQSILESQKIPYTHSGVFASSLAMDKELSRLIFIKNNIKVPKYLLLQKKNKLNLNKKIGFPIVIKPINEGSSLGVSICKNRRQFINKYKKLIKKYNRILVEKYIPGREIQVAVMGEKALGAIELVPKRQFYDYIAKYSSGARTQHIMPASLSREKYKEVLDLAKKAHKLLGCRGITRSDFRFFKNKFYLLETNTQPGMTKLSLVPEIAKYCGINFEDLVVWMIKDASCNR
ncbi:MAG: D-alanine--D-alanine ligase [Pelagibacteraceae bacterium]|jgi:D-alanine-D-alanine ligase|nr:D-alanine--D-alanine ligase [Candidatus Pelagibacter sp.]MDP6680298.1 D-alanine--D-alanine ligase [Pelagibacteraceae bacterium]MDP6710364.1 D-alanine--D-alanine ligase [Pelagibacteraceae bacterium]